MIRGRCVPAAGMEPAFTGRVWPSSFVAVPREGECVQADVARGAPGRLRVARVTHEETAAGPGIIVELRR